MPRSGPARARTANGHRCPITEVIGGNPRASPRGDPLGRRAKSRYSDIRAAVRLSGRRASHARGRWLNPAAPILKVPGNTAFCSGSLATLDARPRSVWPKSAHPEGGFRPACRARGCARGQSGTPLASRGKRLRYPSGDGCSSSLGERPARRRVLLVLAHSRSAGRGHLRRRWTMILAWRTTRISPTAFES